MRAIDPVNARNNNISYKAIFVKDFVKIDFSGWFGVFS